MQIAYLNDSVLVKQEWYIVVNYTVEIVDINLEYFNQKDRCLRLH